MALRKETWKGLCGWLIIVVVVVVWCLWSVRSKLIRRNEEIQIVFKERLMEAYRTGIEHQKKNQQELLREAFRQGAEHGRSIVNKQREFPNRVAGWTKQIEDDIARKSDLRSEQAILDLEGQALNNARARLDALIEATGGKVARPTDPALEQRILELMATPEWKEAGRTGQQSKRER